MKPATMADARNLSAQVFAGHFSKPASQFLQKVFKETARLFSGDYPGYQACDTPFHDITHTCDATVALARILDGHLKSRQPPLLRARDFELAVAGVLLHDSGYLKAAGDNEGTGAKYTLTHVERSAQFAAAFLPPLGVSPEEVRVVQEAIRCTGIKVDTSRLNFPDERARFIGHALGTGDILGQMASDNYPYRLPELYLEFKEAGITSYASAEDLMRKTRSFYQNHIRSMLESQWGGAHRALQHHFPDGRNHYFDAIVANLDTIDGLLPGESPAQR
jgi:hypothetical protein